MQRMVKIIIYSLLTYIAYCLFLFVVQRKIMYPVDLIALPPESTAKVEGMETIWLDTPSGKVEAWFLVPHVPQAAMPSPAVIFGHGNGEVIDFWPEILKPFTDLGIGVLLVEYPGYGRSGGRPSQTSISQTFVAAYDVLVRRKDVDPSKIILFGRSLGGGAVCALAQERPSAALILLSTFTSVRSFAWRYLAPAFLMRDPFDNLSAVTSYAEPVLIIHGRKDNIIPYKHAVLLHRAAKGSRLITYECGHNDCPRDWNVFWQDVKSFLSAAGVIVTPPEKNMD